MCPSSASHRPQWCGAREKGSHNSKKQLHDVLKHKGELILILCVFIYATRDRRIEDGG
jgi:hypothetical protein